MPTFTSGAVTVMFEADADQFEQPRKARVAVQDIPGGTTFYVDQAGVLPLYWNTRLELANSTQVGRLYSVLGESGTLSITGLDPHTAVLLSANAGAPYADGRFMADVEFLITDV